jgi:hypothetical protein
MHVIDEALGDDADGILPQAIRSAELRVRVPRHHIDMLEYRGGPAGDHRQRRAGAGAGRHRQTDEKPYPQMTQIERRWRTVFICVPSASSADRPRYPPCRNVATSEHTCAPTVPQRCNLGAHMRSYRVATLHPRSAHALLPRRNVAPSERTCAPAATQRDTLGAHMRSCCESKWHHRRAHALLLRRSVTPPERTCAPAATQCGTLGAHVRSCCDAVWQPRSARARMLR